MTQRRLYSVSDLAVELTRDRRTVGNKLRNVPPDGELNGRPAWFMMTAVRAVYLDREGTLDGEYERARKDKELADKTALQNAVTRSRVARIRGGGAMTPTPFWVQAMRADSGRPSSSMRFRTATPTFISVARRSSVRERSPSPITRLNRPMVASAWARAL